MLAHFTQLLIYWSVFLSDLLQPARRDYQGRDFRLKCPRWAQTWCSVRGFSQRTFWSVSCGFADNKTHCKPRRIFPFLSLVLLKLTLECLWWWQLWPPWSNQFILESEWNPWNVLSMFVFKAQMDGWTRNTPPALVITQQRHRKTGWLRKSGIWEEKSAGTLLCRVTIHLLLGPCPGCPVGFIDLLKCSVSHCELWRAPHAKLAHMCRLLTKVTKISKLVWTQQNIRMLDEVFVNLAYF